MYFLFEWLVIVGIIVLLTRSSRNRVRDLAQRVDQALERLTAVEAALNRLEGRIASPEGKGERPVPEQKAEVSPAAVAPSEFPVLPTPQPRELVPPTIPEPKVVVGREAAPPVEPFAAKIEPPHVSELEQRLRRIEQLFIENWTGILGAVVLVAGVTFIGIYMALRLAPLSRFLMTVAMAAVLFGASLVLRRREAWRALSEWVRSAGAAIFLFACAAAGGLPGLGLQWIRAPLPTLAVLLTGMAVNLSIGYAGKSQTFAALHVVLSLLPMTIIPQSVVSLGIATFVALFGVTLAFRARWDVHLLTTIVAYLVYHISWYVSIGEALQASSTRSIALLCSVAVFGAAAFVHYRKDYASHRPGSLPLFAHITNWILLALALLIYQVKPELRALGLALVGIVAHLLARRGRLLGVRWVYLCDTLIGQALVIAGIISLSPLVANEQLLLLALFLETLLFLRLVLGEGEDLLSEIALYSSLCAGAILIAGGVISLSGSPESIRNENAIYLLLGAVAGTIAHVHFTRTYGETFVRLRCFRGFFGVSEDYVREALGYLVGLIVVAALANLLPGRWMEVTALLAVGGLLLLSRRLSPPGFAAASALALVISHLLSWFWLLKYEPWTSGILATHIGPLSALGAFSIWMISRGVMRQAAIYLFGLNVGLAVFLFFNPLSPLVPGVAWLLLSLVALEFANRLEQQVSASVLGLGYLYLVAFAGAYALVVLQTQAYIGIFRARLLIEVFALGVLVYWWLFRPRESLQTLASWVRVHPLFLEFALVLLAATILVEVPMQWRSVTWSTIALILLARPLVKTLDERFQLYSLIFYWLSVLNVVVLMSTFETPSPNWHDRPDVMAILGITLQIAYIIVSHRRLELAEVRFPAGLGWMTSLALTVARRRPPWIYYPFFVGVALFFYWRFDRSVLTLLWSAEAFVVFVLSAILRENQFRYIALGALGACLLRLVVFDMVQANIGLRGLIFFGVGSLMISMNAIYNRYRRRFK